MTAKLNPSDSTHAQFDCVTCEVSPVTRNGNPFICPIVLIGSSDELGKDAVQPVVQAIRSGETNFSGADCDVIRSLAVHCRNKREAALRYRLENPQTRIDGLIID